MKQGWEIKDFVDVCTLVGGSQPSKDDFIYEPKDGYIRLIQVRDYRTDKYITYIPKEKAKRFCTTEDIMIGRYGPPIFGIFKGLEGAYNVALMKAVVNEKICNKDYFYLFLQTDSIRQFVEHSSKRAAGQDGVRKELLDKYPVPLPPLPEQQRIVSILDEAFAAIAKAKANAEQNLKNAKELFDSYLQGVFENGKWEKKTIEMVCDEIFAGGDAPKNNFSLEPNEKHTIPIYANAVKDRGLYGYTDFARVTKPCVTIAARGSGTGHTELRNEHFLPIVRLIVCIPNTKQISTEFLKYTIDNLVIQRSGSAIPQLTVPMIKDYKIPVPSIEEQKQIIEKAETLKQQKESLENVNFKKIEGLEELKKSILQKAFAGEL